MLYLNSYIQNFQLYKYFDFNKKKNFEFLQLQIYCNLIKNKLSAADKSLTFFTCLVMCMHLKRSSLMSARDQSSKVHTQGALSAKGYLQQTHRLHINSD
jgi:hypothetical protein